MWSRLRFWLEASRPGLWFPTIWLYALPLGGRHLLGEWTFWAGLLWVMFPLNFVVYGWNDLVDTETDRLNPRKGNLLFGAQGDDAQLAALPRAMVVVGALTWLPFALIAGPRMLLLMAAIIAVLGAYNHPRWGLRGRPPLELVCQFGYLMVVPFSVWLNDVPHPPWPTYLYLSLFAIQSQLMGEVMDVEPDRAAGRATTATRLGVGHTKLLIIAVVAAEAGMLLGVYRDLWFGGALVAFLGWLVLDRALIIKTEQYTLTQMKLFGVLTNLVAIASMLYAWWSACLLRIP